MKYCQTTVTLLTAWLLSACTLCSAAVENIQAQAGMDIGGTLIGMHLQAVAVPCRLNQNRIGDALILAARTRPKFIGGERAYYNENLK